MNEIEEQIFDYLLEEGFSSNARKLIKKNVSSLSSEFLTDILVEHVNLFTSYLTLINYLPYIWKEDNSSKNLLNYLNGLAHRLFYLAREYPLGKDFPKVHKEELDQVHARLCDFMKSCLNEELLPPASSISDSRTFSELLNTLSNYPKYPQAIIEIFQILAQLYYRFTHNVNQKLRNQDELGAFVSRCLVFWKLGVMDDERMVTCFEKSVKMYLGPLEKEKFLNILALEIQNYQFLQLGINRKQVELIAEVFVSMYN